LTARLPFGGGKKVAANLALSFLKCDRTAQHSAHQWSVIIGAMHYIMLILAIVAFVIWDVNMNRAKFTQPVAHFAYRVAGGY
jgi:hypothetical protein